MKILTVDRFEGDIAVCEREDMTTIDIQLDKLPRNVKVGNVLIIADDGTITIDEEEENRRRNRIYSLYKEIVKNDLMNN